MSPWIVLAALLAVAVVVAVALPFLREPAPASDALHELDPDERRLLEAQEERDRALAALQELEADHRAGRISDDDYRAVVGALRRDAAEALRALDRLGAARAGTSDADAKIEG
ncbi:MAG TPA: hypothetical protein VFM41_09575 [Gaiella sp.]|nr:hypothetical protein [Gaiella sp.]